MKIVLTGAGGGHFYPLIAVAESLKEEAKKEIILDNEIYFFSDKPYNENLLKEKNIEFIKIPSGKMRLYFSLSNLLDPFKSIAGFFVALFQLFKIYPDVVFTKGGYASMPVVFAAKILFIPIFMHESDSVPGKTNLITAKLAKRIAVSYSSSGEFFPIKKTAYTGQPIMEEYLPTKEKLENKILSFKNPENKKTVFILGGSQGSEKINDLVVESLADLIEKYNIIHQVGENNFKKVAISTEMLLKNNPNKDSYHFFSFGDLAKFYEKADICVTRAGSSLFEMSAWGIPTIVVPITNSNGNHQIKNAYTFEKNGCSMVLLESNLKKNLLISSIDSILYDKNRYESMQANNLSNFKSGAANMIAKEIIKIGMTHRS